MAAIIYNYYFSQLKYNSDFYTKVGFDFIFPLSQSPPQKDIASQSNKLLFVVVELSHYQIQPSGELSPH